MQNNNKPIGDSLNPPSLAPTITETEKSNDALVAEKELQLRIAHVRITQLETQLEFTYSSLSWRLTAPLRRIGLRLPQLFNWFNSIFGKTVSPPIKNFHKVARGKSLSEMLEATTAGGSIGIQIHLYYADLLEEISSYVANMPFEHSLYVSVAEESQISLVRDRLSRIKSVKECIVREVPNRGRDVAPLVVTFAKELLKHDFICHLHSKKSLFTGKQQDSWRRHFYKNLLGSPADIRKIFGIFEANNDVGIIYPETHEALPYWAHSWLSNKSLGKQVCARLGIVCDFSGYIDSPMGTMFWARTDALRPILTSGFKIEDFPEEIGQTDGTLAHTLERVVVPVALTQGFTFCEINNSKNQYSLSFGSRNLYQYWAKNLDELKRQISQHEVITFDIFDTLLTRPLLDPDSVFDLLAIKVDHEVGIRNFREARKSAEYEIRSESGFGSDVGIEEIYQRIGKRLTLDKTTTARLCSLEKELEKRLNRPRDEVIDALEFAVGIGKRVVLMSDMYLDAVTVRELLSKNGIQGYDELLLSSSIGVRKDDASMWLKLLESNRGSSILHIGDNEHSDVQIPISMGINVYHVMSPKNIFSNSCLGRDFSHTISQNVGNSAFLGLSLHRLFKNPFGIQHRAGSYTFTDKFEVGYVLIGPIVLAYVLWLLKSAIKDNISKLLFIAREGYLLKQIFDSIQTHPDVARTLKSRVDSLYLLASRRATTVPAIFSVGDALGILDKHYHGTMYNLLKSRFGVEREYLQEAGVVDSYVELPVEYENIAAVIKEHFNVIANRAQIERHNYMRYLKDLGLLEANSQVAVSDLGYSGNIQKALSRLMEVPLNGYYFATCVDVKERDKLSNTFKGYFAEYEDPRSTDCAVYRYSLVLESILTSPDGQLMCFKNSNGINAPVYGDANIHFDNIKRTQNGIAAYCGDALEFFGAEIFAFEPDPKAIEILFKQIFSENQIDSKLLSQLKVEDMYCLDGDISAI